MSLWQKAGLALACTLIGSTAFSMEAWEGTKHILRGKNDSNYYTKITLNGDGKGTIVTVYGSAPVTISHPSKDELVVSVRGNISSVHYPFLPNPFCGESDDPMSSVCQPQQVATRSQLQAMIFEGSENNASVQTVIQRCSTFPNPSEGPMIVDCETETTELDPMLMLDKLPSNPLGIKAGDKVVVPIDGVDDAYLQLNGDYSVTTLDIAHDKENSVTMGKKIVKWNIAGEKLQLTLDNGSTLSYSNIQNFDGVARVVGTLTSAKGMEATISGAAVIDQEIDMSAATKATVSGIYKAISSSASTANGGVEYIFSADGRGGLESVYAGALEPQKSVWKWDLVDGQLTAQQFVAVENDAIISYVQNEEELDFYCGEGSQICKVRTDRSYKILAQEGNRYVMLRKMTAVDPVTGETRHEGLSVWVLYKR